MADLEQQITAVLLSSLQHKACRANLPLPGGLRRAVWCGAVLVTRGIRHRDLGSSQLLHSRYWLSKKNATDVDLVLNVQPQSLCHQLSRAGF